MWQRIQTLYLAIATALSVAMFFSTKAVIPAAADHEEQLISFISYTPYLILLAVVSLLDILALTTYRHRVFQMRTSVLTALITLALQIWLVVDFVSTHSEVIFKLPAVFPAVSCVLEILAARSILADEMMVRSASRLRSSRKR